MDITSPSADIPDLQGRLGSITLTDILQLLGGAGQTGMLTLTQGWNGRTISYLDGRISYVSAVTPLPDVADLLVAAGRLQESSAAYARKEQERHPSNTIEQTLKELGLATDDDLFHAHEQQIEELLYTFFLWRECTFTFRSGPVQRQDGLPIDISIEHLILEGVRLVDEWIEISPIVPTIRMVFEQATDAFPPDLSEDTRAVFEQVNGVADVASVARLCGLTQFTCAKVLYELGNRGLVRAVPPDKARTIQLFNQFLEGIYTKLGLFGYHVDARQFMEQVNNYSRLHGLKIRMRGGKIDLDDLDLPIDTAELIDRYRTFLAVQTNKFERSYDVSVSRGLISGIYTRLSPDLQALMGVYDFVHIEGLFDQLRARKQDGTPGAPKRSLVRTRR